MFTEESWQADPSLNILSRLTGLTSLNLRSTHFSSGLEQLAALTCLQHLDLSLNPSFNGSGDAPKPMSCAAPHVMVDGFITLARLANARVAYQLWLVAVFSTRLLFRICRGTQAVPSFAVQRIRLHSNIHFTLLVRSVEYLGFSHT